MAMNGFSFSDWDSNSYSTLRAASLSLLLTQVWVVDVSEVSRANSESHRRGHWQALLIGVKKERKKEKNTDKIKAVSLCANVHLCICIYRCVYIGDIRKAGAKKRVKMVHGLSCPPPNSR
jgi:hypothetical protein